MERELTSPIGIADAEGRLRRDAIGWARRPLHQCDLPRALGRVHAFDYWCVMTREVALSVLVADVGVAGVALVSVLDLARGDTVERVYVRPGGLPAPMPADTEGEIVVDVRRLSLAVGGPRIEATARTITGRRIEVALAIVRPPAHETVNVLVPWGDTQFHCTSKQQALPAVGYVRVDGRTYDFSASTGAFACRDYGRGRWPGGIDWCWAFASTRLGARTLGFNLGARWTDDTGVTENAIVLDGRVHKIAEPVDFELAPRSWTIRTRGSDRVALTFTPQHQRRVKVPPILALHQCFGHFDGTLVDDTGARLVLDRVLGLAETVHGRWSLPRRR